MAKIRDFLVYVLRAAEDACSEFVTAGGRVLSVHPLTRF